MTIRSTLVAAVLTAGLAMPLAAQEHARSVQPILAAIMEEQNVRAVERVDPYRVSDARLAELGDAVMDVMFPDGRQHAYMDQMMGGAGSKSLEAMHRSMGYAYLAGGGEGGWEISVRDRGGWGMMGPWMMGGWRGYGWGGHPMSAGPGVWVLVALLAAAVGVLAIALASRCGRRQE